MQDTVKITGLYLLRWRFDYADRASVFGMWNSPHISAWDKNREGVVRASIEAKDVATREVRTVVACDGHEFRNFQWLAVAAVGPFRGSVTPATHNIGLKLLTRDEEIAILVNGKGARRLLTEDEKNINFATFGR